MGELWRSVFAIKPVVAKPPPDAPGPQPAPPSTPQRVSSIAFLAPSFRRDVIEMVADLRDSGYEPLVWETYRTRERAELLKRKGSSKNGTLSLHRYGAAVDVICGRHYWACDAHGCDFYAALGAAVKRRWLYWGGDCFPANRITRRRFVDRPHVQAVSYAEQSALRAAGNVEAYLRRRAEVVS